MKTTDEIIKKYLHFNGDKKMYDFAEFLKAARLVKLKYKKNSRDYILIEYIENKLIYGLSLCISYGTIDVIIEEQSREDIETILKDEGFLSGTKTASKKTKATPKKKSIAKKKAVKKKAKKKGLGKIVDSGQPAKNGNSDEYWKDKGIDLVFEPNDEKVRVGDNIPATYAYSDFRFLEKFYGLRGIEFGNWLSQQDRLNYLSGLGIALFDFHKAINFTPKQISIKGKLSIAFGARGRGKARAHFEPLAFVINLTRYSRPKPLETRPSNFNRVNLITSQGGVGSFAHEYGHALDSYGAMHVERGEGFSLSGDDSEHTEPDLALMKKTTLRGLMEKLLYKIIWQNSKTYSPYYIRLQKEKKKGYYLQRDEIFARAFEVYVHYKLDKHKYKNVFLNKTKYNAKLYLAFTEMKKLEPDFDALINALKKHL